MSQQNTVQDARTCAEDTSPNQGGSASGSGILALALSAAALLSAPLLLFLPYLGFMPAITAACGIVAAAVGLRVGGRDAADGRGRGRGIVAAGLVSSVLLFTVLAGAAGVWSFLVMDPALRDYDELHEVIDHIRSLVLGG